MLRNINVWAGGNIVSICPPPRLILVMIIKYNEHKKCNYHD